MIAVPVKTDKENTAVTTLFGKSKWFAFVDDNKVEIVKNELESGRDVVTWLINKGVDTLIFNSMGGNPFMLLQKASIKCFHSGLERIELKDVIIKFKNSELIEVNGSNMHDFVEKGKMHGNNSHEHKHHHDHEHKH